MVGKVEVDLNFAGEGAARALDEEILDLEALRVLLEGRYVGEDYVS